MLSINGRGTKGLEIDLPQLTASMTNAGCGVSGEGLYTMSGDLDICNASGTTVPASTQTTVEIYVDRDGSLDYSVGDTLIHTETTTMAIPGNDACLTIPNISLTLPDSLAARQGVVTVIRRTPINNNAEQCVCESVTSENFICNTILPVTILDFTGSRLSNGTNELTWEVSNEENLMSYELFVSKDQQQWNLVGSVAAKNVFGEKRTLRLTDEDPSSSDYYRLRMIDLNGDKTAHNKIVHIGSRAVQDGNVMVYPNPTTTELNFVYDLDQDVADHFLRIELVDLSGRVLHSQTAELNKSNNRTVLSTQSLASGTYILRYKDVDTGEAGFVKFTKQ